MRNTVSGAGLIGIRAPATTPPSQGLSTGKRDGNTAVEGQDVTVERNRFGVDAGSTVVGNTGAGVVVGPGAAVVERNVVAGSGSAGIDCCPRRMPIYGGKPHLALRVFRSQA